MCCCAPRRSLRLLAADLVRRAHNLRPGLPRARGARCRGVQPHVRVGRRYEALQDIFDHISEGLEERQAARHEADDRATQLIERWSKMREEYCRAFTEVHGAG